MLWKSPRLRTTPFDTLNAALAATQTKLTDIQSERARLMAELTGMQGLVGTSVPEHEDAIAARIKIIDMLTPDFQNTIEAINNSLSNIGTEAMQEPNDDAQAVADLVEKILTAQDAIMEKEVEKAEKVPALQKDLFDLLLELASLNGKLAGEQNYESLGGAYPGYPAYPEV